MKTKLIPWIVILFVAYLFSGCTSIQTKICEVRGGAPWVNLGGYQGCEEKYDDGGKTCSASSDCEGTCFLPWNWEPKEYPKPEGTCSHDAIENCVAIEHYKTMHGGCIEE